MGTEDKKKIMATLEDLKTKLKGPTKNIQRIKHQLDIGSVALQLTELECRLESLNKHIEKANHLQSKIDELDVEDDDDGELEELCILTKSGLLSLINALKADSSHNATVVSASATGQSRSHLPKLSLPKFSGKYSEYKNFISLFDTLVHNDDSIPTIEKFTHLISCLSGEALGTVRAFQIIEDNYKKAKASLKNV